MITRTPNASLKPLNTFGIDCRCRELVEFDSPLDLLTLFEEGFFKSDYLILGGGANTLFDTDFLDRAVLRSRCCGFGSWAASTAPGKIHISAGSGWRWDELVAKTISMGYFGLECLSGIPGDAGGAAVQNIGAYGLEISKLIDHIRVFDTATGTFSDLSNGDCGFAYRKSILKNNGNRLIVCEIALTLSTLDAWQPTLGYAGLKQRVGENPTPAGIRRCVLALRDSKLPSPYVIGSAGSFFTNPVIDLAKAQRLKAEYPGMPQFPAPGTGVKLAAGWLIEQTGWKGKSIGDAGVYEHNALVLVNLGDASGCQILALADAVANDVELKFNVRLRPEVIIVK